MCKPNGVSSSSMSLRYLLYTHPKSRAGYRMAQDIKGAGMEYGGNQYSKAIRSMGWDNELVKSNSNGLDSQAMVVLTARGLGGVHQDHRHVLAPGQEAVRPCIV